MDFNYTLRFRTFDQLLEDVSIDLNTFALENMIEPQQLIKLVKKINYDLGLRINQTREVVLEVCHGRVKLPDDFYVFNHALICGEYTENVGYDGMAGGTNIQEVPYVEVPATVDTCAAPTVNCSVCNHNPCNNTAACEGSVRPPQNYIPTEFNPNSPYGDTCIRPRVFMNCKGDKYELIQIVRTGATRTFRNLRPLRMRQSQDIHCDCPNIHYNTRDEGWLKEGFLFTNFETGRVYLNYQGEMTNENGELLVPDHDLLNEYYEYALKQRILENLFMNGEDVTQRLSLIEQKLRAARNQALSLVNTPNFKEMEQLWWTNRRAMYSKYYDMFKSYSPNNSLFKAISNTRVR
jgi:hypothetical protein